MDCFAYARNDGVDGPAQTASSAKGVVAGAPQ
jgi:hypothetical protein